MNNHKKNEIQLDGNRNYELYHFYIEFSCNDFIQWIKLNMDVLSTDS